MCAFDFCKICCIINQMLVVICRPSVALLMRNISQYFVTLAIKLENCYSPSKIVLGKLEIFLPTFILAGCSNLITLNVPLGRIVYCVIGGPTLRQIIAAFSCEPMSSIVVRVRPFLCW